MSDNIAVSETTQSGLSENSLGALSYLTVIPAILFLAIAPYNRSAYVRFHAWQSIIVGALAFVANFALNSILPMAGFGGAQVLVLISACVAVAYTLVMVLFAVRALNGKRSKLPLIGAWAERQSSK